MSDRTYLKLPIEEREKPLQPFSLFSVVNHRSHYFGCIVEAVDAHDSWVKDGITGLWFNLEELEDYDPAEDLEDSEELSENF